jgi:hypothetical protein
MNRFTPHQMAALEATQPDLYSLQHAAALGMALERRKSLPLILALRGFADAGPGEAITFRFSGTDGGLLLAANGTVAPIFDAVGRLITLDQICTAQPILADHLTAASNRMLADSKAVLQPLFEPARMPDRQKFDAIARWTPLTVGVSYRLATRLIDVVQTLRDGALKAEPTEMGDGREALTHYYSLLQTCAHLTLLASPPEGRPWFADMAKTFAWVNWTPTLSLSGPRIGFPEALATQILLEVETPRSPLDLGLAGRR